MRKLILFDIDGTLLLTGGAGKLAFNHVFEENFGIQGAWQNIHPDGRTDPSLIKELFEKNLGRHPSPQEADRIEQAYGKAMSWSLQEAKNFRLMPGVLELLKVLEEREMGWMGLATGNFEKTAYLKLERAGLRNFFRFGGFGSDHPDRLELTRLALERGRQSLGRWVPAEEVWLIGDTVEDIRCGKLLGLNTVAVATGSTTKGTLVQHRPDFVLDSLQPLGEVLMVFE